LAGDERFFARNGPHTLAAVADVAEAKAAPHRLMLTGVAPLQTAEPDQVSFLDNRKYLAALCATRAGAVIVRPELAASVPDTAVALVTDEPYAAWARVAALFHPLPSATPGVHPTAIVDPAARVDPSAGIGPFVVVGARAEIGARCRVDAHAMVGEGVVIGRDCRIGAHVSLSHALLGDRVVILPGARIGQDGFGVAVTASGMLRVPQLGRVILEDDVEIGANTTIDRGSLQDTMIGAGSRIDNQVQIGHNVQLGRNCVIVAQVGISGSTIIGDQVMIGGQAGLTGHLQVGRGARIGAQTGVMADVPAGAEILGSPAQPAKETFRQIAILRKLARNSAKGVAAEAGRGADRDPMESKTD
jgi:UDP-3-O-[3-hydroxymyristoyl] glucosamine N-acyltransferase